MADAAAVEPVKPTSIVYTKNAEADVAQAKTTAEADLKTKTNAVTTIDTALTAAKAELAKLKESDAGYAEAKELVTKSEKAL